MITFSALLQYSVYVNDMLDIAVKYVVQKELITL
jgi:hypothetical protein